MLLIAICDDCLRPQAYYQKPALAVRVTRRRVIKLGRRTSASPSKKGVRQLKTSITGVLVPANTDPWPEIRDQLNSSLRGWSNYFCLGTRQAIFRAVDRYVYERVRDFLARRHKVAGRGPDGSPTRPSMQRVSCASKQAAECATVDLAGKPVGKPDAGDRHVRFDERDGKRSDGHRPQPTAPILDSTFLHLRGHGVRQVHSDNCRKGNEGS